MSAVTTKPARRNLKFDSLDDVVRDAESLLASGYVEAGNWSLGQVCRHLAEWMQFPLDGYPRPPAPVRLILWVMKHAIGKRQCRKILATGKMQAGGATLRETVPVDRGDDAAGVETLRRAVERFKRHEGPLHPSLLFGELDKGEATRLQLVHCAHHLSFLVPKAP